MSSTPIADLSYRNYDGPIDSPNHRWWVIAKQVMRISLKKKSLWVLVFLTSSYYLMMMAVIYFTERSAEAARQAIGNSGQMVDPMKQFMARMVWKDQFLHGLSYGQLWFFLMALLIGAGLIANDNRSNALLVYLSKPCEKKDYLMGKWMGMFLCMSMAMAIPTFFFYTYGIMNYREYGFFRDDPWLIVKLVTLIPLLSGFYTSLMLGISSVFNQGRLAGASFAAIYFLSNFFTIAMNVIWHISSDQGSNTRGIIDKLFYASVDGIEIGVTKAILNTAGTMPFGMPGQSRPIPAPPIVLAIGALVGLSVLSMWLAWTRVRAVEIVG